MSEETNKEVMSHNGDTYAKKSMILSDCPWRGKVKNYPCREIPIWMLCNNKKCWRNGLEYADCDIDGLCEKEQSVFWAYFG